MKMHNTTTTLGVKKMAAIASGALVLGALGLAAAAGAQDSGAPGPDKAPADCPRAQGEAKAGQRPGHGPEGDRQAWRRGGEEAFARHGRQRPPRAEFSDERDGFGPPPRGEFGRGPEGNGPPRRHGGEGRGFRQGPPPRGEFGEGPEGFGPPPRGENGASQGRRPHGFGGPGRPDGSSADRADGPPRPMGPPSFGDVDTDGDGNISKAEFEAFHVNHRPNRPPRMREDRRPAPPAPGSAPAAPPAPPAPAAE